MSPVLGTLVPVVTGLFSLTLLIICLDKRGGSGGVVHCLTSEMEKALDDPRNQKFWSWLLTQRNPPEGTILISEEGIASWKSTK